MRISPRWRFVLTDRKLNSDEFAYEAQWDSAWFGIYSAPLARDCLEIVGSREEAHEALPFFGIP